MLYVLRFAFILGLASGLFAKLVLKEKQKKSLCRLCLLAAILSVIVCCEPKGAGQLLWCIVAGTIAHFWGAVGFINVHQWVEKRNKGQTI